MGQIKRAFISLKSFRWSLWLSLCALSLVPAIYQVIRTALVSGNASTEGIDILGQMEWFDLIDETLKAFLIVPLYSLLNKSYVGKHFPKTSFKFGLIVIVLYSAFSLGVYFYGEYLIAFMNPAETDIEAISSYLRLETVAFMIGILPSFFSVCFVVLGKPLYVYIFLAIQISVGIVSDFLLIPSLGPNGVAISNILANSLLGLIGFIILLTRGHMEPSWFRKEDKETLLSYVKVGFFSGSQQFIDNFIYAIMVVKMVNAVAEQGNYWAANNFIWGWLLIPMSALSEVIKGDCKENNVTQSNYYLLALFSFLLWVASIPAWKPFLSVIEKLENYESILRTLLKLVPFYLAYGLAVIPDSIFIGKGRTYLTAINSLLVNCLYYGIWFVLYQCGAISFGMNTIVMMFGFGMVFHLAISWCEQWLLHRKAKRKKPPTAL